MVGMPMGRALPPSSGVSPDDVDAQEILAFVKSYAGKREEARELVEDEPNQVEGREGGEQKSLAELQLAEDKKQDFAEEEVPELVRCPTLWPSMRGGIRQDLQILVQSRSR